LEKGIGNQPNPPVPTTATDPLVYTPTGTMAPSYSTLKGANRRNTAEISRLLAFSMNKPAIPMVNPKKGKSKDQTTLSKDDIRNVTHEIHYTKNSDDKYTKVMAKLTDDSGPEEYCI